MTESEFKHELDMAVYFMKCDEQKHDYWMGYVNGLRKGFYGDRFETQIGDIPEDDPSEMKIARRKGFYDALSKFSNNKEV